MFYHSEKVKTIAVQFFLIKLLQMKTICTHFDNNFFLKVVLLKIEHLHTHDE